MRIILLPLAPVLALGGLLALSSCAKTPADAAVDAATSGMGPARSAAVRKATGHGTGPVEKAKNEASDKIEDIRE